MAKCVRDGKVAVIYSPTYGCDWSATITDEYFRRFLLHDEHIVELIENNSSDKIEEHIIKSCPQYECDWYFGNYASLQIAWLDDGTQFHIDEYDGYESVVINHSDYWTIA